MVKKIAKMNYNFVMQEAAVTGARFHPNSIEPASESLKVKRNPPTLPAYGVKQNDLNKVASYLNKLSTRLSIPKLNSSDSQSSVKAYLKSVEQLDRIEPDNLASTQRILKPTMVSPTRNLEKLQPTTGNPFATKNPQAQWNSVTRNQISSIKPSTFRVLTKDSLLQNSSNANVPTMAGSTSNV